MNSALVLIKKDLQRHRVVVFLPGETEERSLYLIMVSGLTSKLEDFRHTYGQLVTPTHVKVADKIFGNEESENVYGVFLDDNLQMVFAFNRAFADYVGEKKAVVFKDVDEVLTDNIEPKKRPDPFSSVEFPSRFDDDDFGRGGGAVMKYSLSEGVRDK